MSAEPKLAITYQIETVAAVREEIQPLLEANWRETGHYDDIALDVDWAGYAAIETAGGLRVYTARTHEILVGYGIFFVRHHLHFQGSLQAVQDVIYVHPDYRASTAARGLIGYTESCLRAEGVQAVYHHVMDINRVGRLLSVLGYDRVGEILAKRLDQE